MIILTGASGGIGRAILPALSALDNVIAIYYSHPPDLTDLKNVTAQQLDLTSEREINDFVISVKAKQVTLLHAAALSKDGLVAQYHLDDWERVIDVNLRGNFLLTRALLSIMINNKWGRVIHFSSIAGLYGMPGTIAYSTAKTGLLGMSRVLANEYARFGITSNVLVLGYFNTGLIETLSEKIQKKVLASIPSGRLGNPLNILYAIEFLIKSDFVNGSAIHVDGGV